MPLDLLKVGAKTIDGILVGTSLFDFGGKATTNI
jgi:hypothetical protein